MPQNTETQPQSPLQGFQQTFDQYFEQFTSQSPEQPQIAPADPAYSFDPYVPLHNPKRDAEKQQRWTRQTLILSVFGVGLTVLAGCLLVAYLPGDRAELARLRVEVDRQTRRANELQATVEEQNELLQEYSKRNEELNESLYDAQQDIKGYSEESKKLQEEFEKLRNKYFSEYAPHE